MNSVSRGCALVLLVISLPAVAEELFNGKDLSGWRVVSGEWTVEDGLLVGRSDDGRSAWLVSQSIQRNGDVTIEARGGRVGVHAYANWLPHRQPTDQDILPALYLCRDRGDEALVPALESHERPNAMYVDLPPFELAEHTLSVSVQSGQPLSQAPRVQRKFSAEIAGRIALEVRPGPKNSRVEFKRVSTPVAITAKPLLKSDMKKNPTKWRPLFDGKSLDGWKIWGEEEWSVEEGTIYGRSGPKKSEGYLATIRTWKDFRIRGQFKILGEGNFGLFYHSTIRLRQKDGYPLISGLQGEVEPSWPGSTGMVYESYKRGWIVKPDHTKIEAYALRPDEWNELEIQMEGNHITTWVNGIRVLDHIDEDQQLFEGSFALQLHTGGVDGIAWKELYVRE